MKRRTVALFVMLGLLAAVAIGCGSSLPSSGTRGGPAGIAARAVRGNAIAYVPIASSVFVSRSTAARWAATHDAAAARNHAIVLWDGLTAKTGQALRGVQLSVYDTWYTPCEIYPVTPTCGRGIINKPTILDLEPPEQFFHLPRVSATDILSSVRYNAEMKAFVDAGYRGAPYPSGAGLVKAMKAGLKDLPDTASPHAMMLKPTYELFSSTQPTVVTYWSGPGLQVGLGASTSPLVPDPTTWLHVALIDPTGKATNAKPVRFCANTIDPAGAIVGSAYYTAPARSYPVIPLKNFYALPLRSGELAIIARNRAAMERRQMADAARSGRPLGSAKACPSLTPPHPVAALIGMHVVTAELKDVWTWQTFWWNPSARPLPGAAPQFRHFGLATAYWTVNAKPYGFRYAFNPYLEANFGTTTFGTPYWPPQSKPGSVINLGRTTNCISCHSQATYTLVPDATPTPIYVAHGHQPQLRLPNSIKTRNLWSLANRAGHP
jgi:hypothetical protein